MPTAKFSNTGMCCSPCRAPPRTRTQCSDNPEARMREIAGIRIPDSKLSVAALDLVKAESHASIYKHVLRTFVFGALAARAEAIRFDDELFFLGAVLHDLAFAARL